MSMTEWVWATPSRAMALPNAAVGLAWRVSQAAQGVLGAAERVPLLVTRVEVLLSAIEALVLRADQAAVGVEKVTARADDVRAAAGEVAVRAASLTAVVDAEVEHALAITRPLLDAAAALDPEFPVEGAALVHSALPVVDDVRTELLPLLLPLLAELRAAVPDLREILSVVQRLEPAMTGVETRLAGLPGAGLLRKRGEREMEDAERDAES